VNPVVIVGAGVSGVATGVALSTRNIPVVLLEQRSAPGGRTRSFPDTATGETLDNGQHVLISGCEATMRYLSALGTRHLLRIQERPLLRFHHPKRGFCGLELPEGRPPWNLVRGVLSADLLPMGDRLRLLRAGAALLHRSPTYELALADLTIDDWLRSTGQSDEARRSLWEPLAVAMMNEHCATASALVFVRSLRQAFFSHWNAAAFALPTVGLSELLINPGIDLIRKKGGEILHATEAVETVSRNGRVEGVRTRDGSLLPATGVVLAVPSDAIDDLLPLDLRQSGFLAGIRDAPLSPIVSIYLWFDRDFMGNEEILGLIGRNVQWIFNRRKLMTAEKEHSLLSPPPPGLVCCVISAAREVVGLPNEDLTHLAWKDVVSAYGDVVTPPVRSVVLREKKATFSSSAAFERLRPAWQTPLANLFVVGDWTATGLPATIEGALLSVEQCAPLVTAWWNMESSGAGSR
jgi:squalene-associated FAD-dependent desaturase